jgi:hypothetical protein
MLLTLQDTVEITFTVLFTIEHVSHYAAHAVFVCHVTITVNSDCFLKPC